MSKFTNKEMGKILQELAALMKINGDNKYRIRAYDNAGRALINTRDDINELAADNRLQEIKGIGEGIADTIQETLEHGFCPALEELRTELPRGVLELVEIPGLGPGRAHELFYELGIKNTAELKAALEEQRVRKLKGFGPKTEENLLVALKKYEKYRDLISINEARQIAGKLKQQLQDRLEKSRISITGSTRRWKETVGDIDILVAAPAGQREKVVDVITELDEAADIIARGSTKVSLRTEAGLQVDFRIVKFSEFPAALQYFTGSKEHNVQLRQQAKKAGLKLNEYGLFREEERIDLETEADIYRQLNLAYIIPELREDRGEVEAAAKNKLPRSVKLEDIKGDLHLHTNYSDGAYSLSGMIEAAADRGYNYLAVTDHSQSLRVASGLSVAELQKQLQDIDELAVEYDIRILKGIEVDILRDGSLDYDDQLLSKLDVVIASIHTGFNQTAEEITDRIIQAMRNPHVDIIGHPRGRLLGRRESYGVNMEEVISAAVETGTCLEINASPHRLDLDDLTVRQAVEKGVKIAINTDAHHPEELSDMELGISVARRGWLEAEDIINTMDYEDLISFLEGDSNG
ncbi:MAG: DNA polymerase/3'-5' exonuclease PolX [bacterium]